MNPARETFHTPFMADAAAVLPPPVALLSCKDVLSAARGPNVVLFLLNVAAAVVAGVALWSNGHSATSGTVCNSLLACFIAGAVRTSCTVATAAAQVRAACGSLLARTSATSRSSPYQALVALRIAGWLLNAAEFGIAVALAVGIARLDDAGDPIHAVPVACLVLEWVCIVIRANLRSDPLQWKILLSRGGPLTWRTHHHGRVTSVLRYGLCCVCEPRAACCGVVESAPGGGVRADLTSASAVALAEFIGGESPERLRLTSIGAGLRLLYVAARSEEQNAHARSRAPPGTPLTPQLVKRCRVAVDLHRYAVGAYTGLMMDLARGAASGLCCWARKQCRSIKLPPSERPNTVSGDNCLNGHRAAFWGYANATGEVDNELLHGYVGNGVGEVSFFCVHRPSARQIIVAVRGTENVMDMIDDLIFNPVPLTNDDVGLPEGASVDGVAFGGVLACARNLASKVEPVVSAALDRMGPDLAQTYTLCLCGHSLGGSTSALAALRLRGMLRKRSVNVVAFCFNPMPIMSPAGLASAAPWINENVLSVVYQGDFASRFSLGRVLRLRDRALATAGEHRWSIGDLSRKVHALWGVCVLSLRCVCNAGDAVKGVETELRARKVLIPLASEEGDARRIPTDARDTVASDEQEMYLAGQVVHVRGDPAELMAVSAFDFKEMVVTPDFLVDHVPWGLQRDFAALLGCSFDGVDKPSSNRPPDRRDDVEESAV